VLLFMLDYALGCITFYTTEVWGLGILRDGVALFLSGALIPLEFLPEGIRAIANFSPWAQALYVPISFLSGIRNPNTLPQAMLGQVFGIVILCLISRWIFSRAVRVLTVQGG
jgi:ABC-2 type transport system permease protein